MTSSPHSAVISELDLRLGGGFWEFAEYRKLEIKTHWATKIVRNPALWNGDFLVARNVQLANGQLSARFAKTDYASFIAWRDWGFPDVTAFNVFGMPLMVTCDGNLIFAEMNGQTAAAGLIYPPGGSGLTLI